MITVDEFYDVMVAMVPLYVVMFLAYASVRWWAIFSPEQCAGINRFVAIFAVPFLCFHFIANNDPYKMNLRFIIADALQKLLVLATGAISYACRGVALYWVISAFPLTTLANTLVIGVPLLSAMYGDFSASLIVQVVVLQCVVWHPLLLFLYEYQAAKRVIPARLPLSRIAPKPSVSSEEGKEIHQTIPAQLPLAKPAVEEGSLENLQQEPSRLMMTKMILCTVGKKLIQNPNIYSSLAGVVWSLIAFRCHTDMPRIVDKSITILSSCGLGTAMFSTGLFTALQPNILSCGKWAAAAAMAMRFLVGPSLMAVTSLAVGLRGTILRIAIVQAALPQAIVTFVFAKDYDVLPSVLCTGVIFGTLIALPVTLLYYVLLGLWYIS